ncbi:hypothetical protein [Catellatospora sp. NPDC049609]|uniref:hypothetical protein n=1 Tax=Catellatospora sp. NPDC049609 TaxID=3155505 RepID=UPI003432871D
MSERDPVRAAFDGARDRLQGAFAPAGVEAVLGTVRRRRIRRRAGGFAAIAALAVLAVAVPWANRTAPPAVPRPSASPSAEQPQPSPSPSPSDAETGIGGAVAPVQPCRARPEAYAEGADVPGDHDVTLGLTASSTFCPGKKVKIFWASYVCQADGTQQLADHEVFHLDAGDRSVVAAVRWPADPEGRGTRIIYVVGDLGVLDEIPAGKRQQYPYWTRARGSGAFGNHTAGDMQCGPPPSASPSPSPSA